MADRLGIMVYSIALTDKALGAIHKGSPAKTRISRPPRVRIKQYNNVRIKIERPDSTDPPPSHGVSRTSFVNGP